MVDGAELSGAVPFAGSPVHVLVDAEAQITEANEDNNLSCTTIRITRLQILQIKPFVRELGPLRLRLLERPEQLGLDRLRVLPGRVQPPQPTGGGEAERTVLEVLSYPLDGAGRPRDAAAIARQGFWLAAWLAIPFFLLVYHGAGVLRLLDGVIAVRV